jgi:pimeloyl-ACP methyl ester carboxylesterase
MSPAIRNLVLLPGLDGTGVLFRPFSAALPQHVSAKIITYPPSSPLALPELGDLVIEQLPAGEFALLAESFSGLVALSLLGKIGNRVRAVIFCGAFATPPRPFLLGMAAFLPMLGTVVRHTPDFLLKKFCVGPRATSEQIGLLREALSLVAPDVLAQRLSLVGSRQEFDASARIPCYYIQATEDRLVSPRCATWFGNHFEHFELKRISGPHFLLQTRPEECAQLVAKIISEL